MKNQGMAVKDCLADVPKAKAAVAVGGRLLSGSCRVEQVVAVKPDRTVEACFAGSKEAAAVGRGGGRTEDVAAMQRWR